MGALIDPDTEASCRCGRIWWSTARRTTWRPASRRRGSGLQLSARRHRRHPRHLDTITALGAHRPRSAGARARRAMTSGDRVRMRVAGLDRPRTMLVIGRQPENAAGSCPEAAAPQRDAGSAGGRTCSRTSNANRCSRRLKRCSAGRPTCCWTARDRAGRQHPAVSRCGTRSPRSRRPEPPRPRAGGDFVVVAGPRLAEGAEAIARTLHPDAFK